ncbi:MAG: SDR family oxidoreductase [Pseudomonadota bacterium]
MHKAVLVTGASSGIGEATTLELAHKGFRVFAAARSEAKLAAFKGLAGDRITPLAMDVTDEASIAAAFSTIAADCGGLFGIVNNAGVSVTGPAETAPLDEWRRQFETNVFGVMNVVRAAAPHMRAAGSGRIVIVGSITGRLAPPFMGVYAASKHALEGLADSLRLELKPFGVSVSLVRPGFTNTPFAAQEQAGLEPHTRDGEPYAAAAGAFKRWHGDQHSNGLAPTRIAELIHRALTDSKPRARYTAPRNLQALSVFHHLAPYRLGDLMMDRATTPPEKENS